MSMNDNADDDDVDNAVDENFDVMSSDDELAAVADDMGSNKLTLVPPVSHGSSALWTCF